MILEKIFITSIFIMPFIAVFMAVCKWYEYDDRLRGLHLGSRKDYQCERQEFDRDKFISEMQKRHGE